MTCIENRLGDVTIKMQNEDKLLIRNLENNESMIISCKNGKLFIDDYEKSKLEDYIIQEKIFLKKNSEELDNYIEEHLKNKKF